MSYILEALKKADHERTLGSVPDLDTPHWGVRRTVRGQRWVWIATALLLVNGVLLAVLLGRGGEDGGGQEIASTPTVAASAPPGGGAEVAQPEPPPRPEPVPAQQPAAAVQPLPGAAGTVVTRPRPRSMTQIVTQSLKPTQTLSSAPQPVDAGSPATAPAAPPQVFVQPAVPELPGQSGVQLWSELPLEFRSSFAMPRIDVHVYSDEPARRFLLVNLQKYREGDTLDSGAVIEEILPQGVRLYYRGTRFVIDK